MAHRTFAPRRMEKQWSPILVGAASVNLTANATALMGQASAATVPQTILRARGEILVAPSAVTAALDECRIGFGLGIVSADAAVVGSGFMPDPIGDPEYPWLWWHVHHFFSPFVVDGTASDDFGVGVVRIPVDTKAMRKMKPAEAVVLVAEYVDTTGTPAIRVAGDIRCLLAT